MQFFTICSNNYLAQACVLGTQLQKVHPSADFTVFLVDKFRGFNPDKLMVNLVAVESIGVPNLLSMIQHYNISEFNTAVKPFCFAYLFRRSDQAVVYLDPDIYPLTPFEEVATALETGADAILTPHILRPVESGTFTEAEFLKLGIYNLGFLALNPSNSSQRFVRWWGRKLQSDCVIDLSRGMFVDQKWADLIPAFVDSTKILRHPGYNVAYWNLHNRKVSRNALYCVNGEQLRFAHLSGLDFEPNSPVISRHYAFHKYGNSGAFGELVDEYRTAVHEHGHARFKRLNYAYFFEPTGGVNLHASGLGRDEELPRNPSTYVECRQFGTLCEYRDHLRFEAGTYQSQRNFELTLVDKTEPGELVSLAGHDFLVDRQAFFLSNFDYAYKKTADGRSIPNWREHLTSTRSGWQNRVRAVPHFFVQEMQPRSSDAIYLTERVTPLYEWFDINFENVIGSELLNPDERLGLEIGGIRNENLEALTFENDRFDFILSFDVLEHVSDHMAALRSVFRCLKPDGRLFFAIPTNLMLQYEHETRAYHEEDGTLVHVMEPEYHGNPVDEGGALCYRYYGWRLLDDLREVGFDHCYVIEYWSDRFGYLGERQMFFVAEKHQLDGT